MYFRFILLASFPIQLYALKCYSYSTLHDIPKEVQTSTADFEITACKAYSFVCSSYANHACEDSNQGKTYTSFIATVKAGCKSKDICCYTDLCNDPDDADLVSRLTATTTTDTAASTDTTTPTSSSGRIGWSLTMSIVAGFFCLL